MEEVSTIPSRTNLAVSLLAMLLNSEFINLLGHIWQWGRKIVTAKTHEGMYEVLECELSLELRDSKGHQAMCSKREVVRFLQDNIIAFQDKVWGDGDIFADYKCSPGIPVDTYREGHRYRVLISLRETKRRGDTEEFRFERRIENGFTQPVEEFQTHIDQHTKQLALQVIFPKNRSPKSVLLIEQNSMRSTKAGPEHETVLPDGRTQIRWNVEKPRLFESYLIHWGW